MNNRFLPKQESFLCNYLSTIADLQIGETGIIAAENLDSIPLKLLEMGCLPGVTVTLLRVAPLQDPLYICVNGSHLAIRKTTASKIVLKLYNEQ